MVQKWDDDVLAAENDV
jgi:hypothetical protein